ncbi:MAG: glycosyltransferase [Cyanobacteriota bacterium]|nr:glycosyltransferase [Cyanobacteriota bacterium]
MARKARILLIHQNFPGQYLHLAQALQRRGDELVSIGAGTARALPGIPLHRYNPMPAGGVPACHPWVADQQTKALRAEAVAALLQRLLQTMDPPDLVLGHPGWGELLALDEVLPGVPLLHQPEFVYRLDGADFGFDPEFPPTTPFSRTRLNLRRGIQLLTMEAHPHAMVPTWFQWSSIPGPYRHGVQVIHEGVDTERIRPPTAKQPAEPMTLMQQQIRIDADSEIVTFASRNLEPYRGFHVFMRMLPALQRLRPNARVIIIGADGVSYGSAPPGGGSWRQALLRELDGQLEMDRIHFVGKLPLPALHAVLRLTRVHVYFTVPFVLSWSMLEAMACGAVLIGSRTAPVQELIRHGDNGLLVDFFDGEGLAEMIARVLADPAAHAPLGKAARRLVERDYDLKRMCLPQQLRLVDRMLSGHPPAPVEPPAELAELLLPG